MKKLTLLSGIALFAGFAGFQSNVSAQISIGQTDLPSIGLTVVTDSDGTTKPSAGVASASSQNWDFSALQKQKSKTVMFVAPSSTKYASNFSAANLADTTIGADGYNYFITNLSRFAVEGIEESASYLTYTFQVELNFNPQFLQSSLPATYNSTAGGVAMGFEKFNQTIAIVDSELIEVHIIYADTVDAYGTMKMPNGGVFPVLRQKHHEVDSEYIYTHTFLGWSLATSSAVNKNQYDWYTKNVGYILAQMDMDPTFTNQLDVIWDTTATVTGINTISVKNSVNVYPNPANTEINFITGANQDQFILVYDIAGRQIEKVAVKNGNAILNTGTYSNGLYLYSLTDNAGNLLDKGKFVVQH